MLISVGMELNNEGRDLAWALDFPGCFAYGSDSSEAVVSLAQELVSYEAWINRHTETSWVRLGDFDLRIVETWQVITMNDRYEVEEGAYAVNAWFRSDWKPLSEAEIENGLALLNWSRADLLRLIAPLGSGDLDRQYPAERWSIRGILKHVANAEWWYLERLGLVEGGRPQMPKEAVDRLAWARELLLKELAQLARRELVIGKQGEFWSPRKLLRRALWHEINHFQHTRRLIEQKERYEE